MGKYGKIVVLAGGPSSEREISLKSGQAVYAALKKKGEDVDFLDVDRSFEGKIKNLKCDVAFLALHGRFGEDGTVQSMLEEMNVSYTGSGVDASRLALDKIASRKIFSDNNLFVPRYMVAGKNCDPEKILSDFTAPFVVKPQREGSSIGLTVVRESSELSEALNKAFKYDDEVLIEEYIFGRELTVGVLENKTLPVVEIVAKNKVYDYDAKYEDKNTTYIVPADLIGNVYEKAQKDAFKAYELLGCRDFSRVDMRMNEEGNIFILEVNTIPGLTERSLLPKAAQATGLDFNELCMKLVHMAYERNICKGD